MYYIVIVPLDYRRKSDNRNNMAEEKQNIISQITAH